MRRIIIGVPVLLVLIIVGAVLTVGALHHSPAQPAPPGIALSTPPAPVPVEREYVHAVRRIPVLAWHQVIGGIADTTAQAVIWNFNKDCKPTAAVCNAPSNDETVSLRQLTSELAWLHHRGYHSVTSAQYDAWVAGKAIPLPAKPILLTVDDGTLNSYVNVTPFLQEYGYNMVTFIVSQFADGATAGKQPYVGWDATWRQLLALPAAQWSFAFHAGARGHNVTFPQNPGCVYFYPCQLPGESDAAYQKRVSGDIITGRKVVREQLGDRMNQAEWAVPWNDLAAQKNLPVSGDDPPRYLAKWAQHHFPVIFIQDPAHNGWRHERYRLEVQGTWTQKAFEAAVRHNMRDGFFNRA